MTQLLPVLAESCNYFLRQGRGALAQGELVSASRAGWQAAVFAMGAYAGPDADFTAAARKLVKDSQGQGNAAEWAVSALALADNTQYDWLDKDSVSRRLDDVQRLVILVKDIAEPPQSAGDVLDRARECVDNGYLIPASDKGWEAALLAAKTYADAFGYRYRDESNFDSVMRILEKEEADSKEVGGWAYAAVKLRKTAVYCAGRSDPRYADIFADDVAAVGNLVSFIQAKVGWFEE